MHLLVILCALLFLGAPSLARAQTSQTSAWCGEEPCGPEVYDKTRTLNGHVFMPFLTTTPFAFVTTRVGSQTGLGYYQLRSVPVTGLGTLSSKAKLVSYTQLVSADFRLFPWMGLTIGFSLGNAVGVNDSGAFNLGINYAFGGTAGLIFRLAHGEKWYLSARVDGAFNYAGAVLPAALTSTGTVDQNGNLSFQLSSLTQTGNIIQGVGALMLAYSPHRMIGFQGNVGFNTNRVDVSSGNTGHIDHVQAGLGSSLRFDSKGVPLAILLGGSIQVETDRTTRVFFSTINTQGTVLGAIEPGLFYSNPKYVDVGLSLSFQLGQNVRRNQAAIVLNHFW